MGFLDKVFGNNKKKQELPVTTIATAKEVVELKESMQKKIDDMHNKMEVMKTKMEDIEKVNESRNSVLSTYVKYSPEMLKNIDKSIKIIPLNKNGMYKYAAALSYKGDIEEELILAQFNNNALKSVHGKLSEQLKYQEEVASGNVYKMALKDNLEALKRYAEENKIVLTEEGLEIMSNTSKEKKNILKTAVYMGGTIKDAEEFSKDEWKDLDEFSIDEIGEIDEGNKVEKYIQDINKMKRPESILDQKSEILDYMKKMKNSKDMKKELYNRYCAIKEKQLGKIINDKIMSELPKDEKTDLWENYFLRIENGRNSSADKYAIENKLDFRELGNTVKNNIPKEMEKEDESFFRALPYYISLKDSYTHNDEKGKEVDKRRINIVLENFKAREEYNREEVMYLASVLDIQKTDKVNENEEILQNRAELLKRQNFQRNIGYIPPKKDDER